MRIILGLSFEEAKSFFEAAQFIRLCDYDAEDIKTEKDWERAEKFSDVVRVMNKVENIIESQIQLDNTLYQDIEALEQLIEHIRKI